MAFFKPTQMKINGKFYPVAVLVDRPMEIDEIAEQIAEMSTVSKADTVAVLAALPGVMARGMNAGRSVHLQDLGFFRYTVAARKGGRDKAEDVTANDVLRARVRFTPETRYSGDTTTRALTPASVRWTRFNGTPVPDAGDDTDGGNGGGGTGGGGEDSEDPMG